LYHVGYTGHSETYRLHKEMNRIIHRNFAMFTDLLVISC